MHEPISLGRSKDKIMSRIMLNSVEKSHNSIRHFSLLAMAIDFYKITVKVCHYSMVLSMCIDLCQYLCKDQKTATVKTDIKWEG